MSSSPAPYLNSPAENGREAIRAAGLAVDALPIPTSDAIRAAVSVARASADLVTTASPSVRWDMGQFTGMRIAKFQNWLYEQNREWHFCDETLCVLWCVEFPGARSDYPVHLDYIDSTRRDYNAGHHQAPVPDVPCVAYEPRRGASV